MRKMVTRALKMLPRLKTEQIQKLIFDMAAENEFLETVLSSLPGGIIVADKDHRVLQLNIPARRMVPLIEGEWLEKPVWSVIRDPEIGDLLKEKLESQDILNEHDFTLDRRGRHFTLSFSIFPLVREGAIQGNLIYIEDVSLKRANETRLRRAESLASLTTLTAGVAHEIKNPLGALSIHIQLMQKIVANEKREIERQDLLDSLEIVNEEVERLNRIVVDYLFAVRPLDSVLKEGCVSDVFKEITSFIDPELENAGIMLKTHYQDNLPCILLDEKLLKQAFLNIINNAVDAMENGGVLDISAIREGDLLKVSIRDTGKGIDQENTQKIFEPYFTTKESGTGLGLTLVYKIVKEHGGDIQVQSKPGEGTLFNFYFPVPQKEQHLIDGKSAGDA